jgi:hypothetical protein
MLQHTGPLLAMTGGPFIIGPLVPAHDRMEFTCGVDALDRYFRQQVGQDVRRRATACFVAREIATDRIAGFNMLAAGGILLGEIPARLAKRLPRYPAVPVARLGRLVPVALAFHGLKLGGALLWDAVERASRSDVAVYALVVDAQDEQAESFYLHHGFVALPHTSRALILRLPKSR